MFREIRRKDYAMDEQEAREVLQRGEYGILAVLGDDGYPYTVPLDYVVCGNTIYFHAAKEGHKIDAIKACNKASFCYVDSSVLQPETFASAYCSIVAFGRVRLVDDETEKMDALKALVEALAGGEPQESKAAEVDACAYKVPVQVIALDIEHISGKQRDGR